MRVLISPFPLTGLDEEGGADYLPGSHARKSSRRPSSEAAGSGTARGAGEEGQEGGHGCSKEFPFLGVRRLRGRLLPRKRGGEGGLSPRGGREEEEGSPNKGGRRVQEGKDYSPGQLRQHQRWRGRMAFKGQASGEIVSIRIPE